MSDISESRSNLSVNVLYGEKAVEGAAIKIYKIADINVKNGNPSVTAITKYESMIKSEKTFDFEKFEETVENLDRSELKDGISAVTDDKGKAVFENVENGLYIVAEAENNENANKYIGFKPFAVFLPMPDYDNGSRTKGETVLCGWKYNVEAYPKTGTFEASHEIKDNTEGKNVLTGDGFYCGIYLISAMISLLLPFFLCLRIKQGDRRYEKNKN